MSGLQAISHACYVLVHEVDRDQFPSDIHIASSNPSTVPHNLYLINALPTAKQNPYILGILKFSFYSMFIAHAQYVLLECHMIAYITICHKNIPITCLWGLLVQE